METENKEFVTFYFNEQIYGVSLIDVQEIIPVPEITKIYHAEKRIFGMINMRGSIYIVLDIKSMLSSCELEIGADSHILIMKERVGTRFGFLVDKIGGIVSTDNFSEIKTEGANARIITGIVKTENKTINIIDLQKIHAGLRS